MCACDDAFVCSRCQGTPDDPGYLDAEREPEYEPHADDASEGPIGLAAWYSARMA